MFTISGQLKEDFINWLKLKRGYYFWLLLPNYFKLQFLVLYFSETNMPIDIQWWDSDGFDWAITKGWRDEVIVSDKISGNRFKTYNEAVKDALKEANRIYNLQPKTARSRTSF